MSKLIKIILVLLITTSIVGGLYFYLVNPGTPEKIQETSGGDTTGEVKPEPAEEMTMEGTAKCKPEKTGLLGTSCEIYIQGNDGEKYVLLDFDIEITEGNMYVFTGFKEGISEDGYAKFTPNSYAKIQ